jgi:hypothetical protein
VDAAIEESASAVKITLVQASRNVESGIRICTFLVSKGKPVSRNDIVFRGIICHKAALTTSHSPEIFTANAFKGTSSLEFISTSRLMERNLFCECRLRTVPVLEQHFEQSFYHAAAF